MKKWLKKSLNLTVAPLVATSFLLTSCQSSFYNQQRIIDAELVENVRSEVQIFDDNYAQLKNFLDTNNSDNYKKYYHDNFKYLLSITDIWDKEILYKKSEDGKIGINEFFRKTDQYTSSIGFLDNNNFAKITEFDEFGNNFIFGKKNKNNSLTIFTHLIYMRSINNEMEAIFRDWANVIFAFGSQIYGFKNLLDENEGYPLFKKNKNPFQSKQYFYDEVVKIENDLKVEIQNRYFDENKKDIEFETLVNSEGSGQHSHAAINIWNEWYSMIEAKNKNNKITLLANFIAEYEQIYESLTDQNKAKDLFLRIQKDQFIFDINLKELMKKLKAKINESQKFIFNDSLIKLEFKNKFLGPITNMHEAIKRLITSYK